MARTPRVLTQLLLAMLIPALAVLFFSGPASAAGRGSAAHFSTSAASKPCGIKHYPPCHHKKPTNHIDKHRVKQGHAAHVHSSNYPAHKTIKVYLKGHGHNKLVAKVTTDNHGNAHYTVKVPGNFKPGRYTLVIKANGVKTQTIHITVTKKHKHHHHHHHHH